MGRKSNEGKGSIKRLDPPEEERRDYLKAVGALVVGLAVGGAAGWLSKPAERVTERVTETVTKTVTAAVTPTATPTPTPTPAPEISAYIVAHSVYFYDEKNLARFTEQTDIGVKPTVESFFTIHDKLATTFAAEVYAWDTCYTWGAWLGEFLEYYQPLDEVGIEVPSEIVDDLIPYARISAEFKGRWYGLPTSFWVMLLHTNKDMFDEAGLEFPETWDEFLECCEALNKPEKGVYAFAAGLKQGYLFPHYCAFLHINNGSLWATDERRTIICDSKEAIRAVEDMCYLYNNYMDPGATEWLAGIESGKAWLTEKAAMTLYYPYHAVLNTLPEWGRFKARSGLIPGKPPVRSGSGSAAEAYAIPRKAKYRKEAWELIKYFASRDVQVETALAATAEYESSWPVCKSYYDDPRLKEYVTTGFVQLVREQATYRCTRYERPAYQKICDIIEAEIVNALTGVKTPEDAMKDAAEACDPIVDEEYAKYGGGYKVPGIPGLWP